MSLITKIMCDTCEKYFGVDENIVECPRCKEGHINLDKQEECCWGCVPCDQSTAREPCYVKDSDDLCEYCQCCAIHCTCPEDEDEDEEEDEDEVSDG